jgi:outer membrane protein assembly factor BamB
MVGTQRRNSANLPCRLLFCALALGAAPASAAESVPAPVRGWLSWRGPQQAGTSLEKGLPERWVLGGANHRWDVALAGRGAPVVANGRVFVMGYRGEGPGVHELVAAFDAESGELLWEHRFNDFLSDTVYDRYAIGSPTVDAETGNVFVTSVAGLFTALDADGRLLWQHSMMEEFGRLTFPNSRTGAPVVDGDLVITRGVTANWGAQGPPRDRFYAFDKRTGAHVWSATPGDAPKDNSFSHPVFSWEGGRRVFYVGLGCGHVAAVDARTGTPLWRVPIAAGGVNASVLLIDGKILAVHGVENLGSSAVGGMVLIDPSKRADLRPPAAPGEPPVLGPSAVVWRQRVDGFSSSPVFANGRVFQTTGTGELLALDAATGAIAWSLKLATDQVHASPLFGDGRLYVPMNDGSFHIVRPEAKRGVVLARVQLAGNALGAPSAWNGKIYVHTTQRLYCFGSKGDTTGPAPAPAREALPAAGPATQLEARPSELLLRPGERVTLSVRALDANGLPAATTPGPLAWKRWIPPTAKVKSELDAEVDATGTLVAGTRPSAGAFEVTGGGLRGTIRGRMVPGLPFAEDFEAFALAETHPTEAGVRFAYPPLPWIGARLTWEVREVGGRKVLAKTLDRLIQQRAQAFVGHPEMRDYTVVADVMSDGNRRSMGSVGVIDQRYLVALQGNAQVLEVSSNHERLRVGVPFRWKPGSWYRLKARVDVAADGSGVVRAKAWPREEAEPAAWTLEVPHANAHRNGSPGFWGFAPQNLHRVYVDSLTVTPNAPEAAR